MKTSLDNLTVRPALAADANAIHEITQEAFAQYSRDLGLPGQVKALSESPADILQDLLRKRIFVAEQDGRIIGSVRCEHIGRVGYIGRFGVSCKAQGSGAGVALLEAAAADATACGICALALHTSSKMLPLMRFYYGQSFYVHSTKTDRGYIRALLVRELNAEGAQVDLSVLGER